MTPELMSLDVLLVDLGAVVLVGVIAWYFRVLDRR
jgi:hypothetical protein